MAELAGLQVLVVEDEGPVALLIEDMLLDLGCDVVASVANASKASQLAATLRIDLALLDLNLNGQSAIPIARILQGRGIPFLFVSGHGAAGVLEEFTTYQSLSKPFVFTDLQRKILLALEQQRP
jgi:CheY-like chemotaxis protein